MLLEINSSWGSLDANLTLRGKKLRPEHIEPLEPNAVAKRQRCQNWGLLAVSGRSCLATDVQLLHQEEKS